MTDWTHAQWRKSSRSGGNGGDCLEVAAARWRKSSRSGGNGGNCVEVTGELGGLVGVRDSKDASGPVLAFAPGSWTAFVAGVKTGHLAR